MKKLVFLFSTLIFHSIGFTQQEKILLKRADSLFLLNKTEDAIRVYSTVLKQNPKSEKALMGRGKSYVNTNRLAGAEKDFREAVRLNSKCADCWATLGIIKFLLGNDAAALSLAEQAIKLDKNNSIAYILKGRLAKNAGKYNEAADYFNKSIAIDSSADAFYFRATLFIESGQLEKAMKDLLIVNRINPGFSTAYYEIGVMFANEQKWDDALRNFLLAIQKDSTRGDYYKVVGNVYVYKDELPLALNYYTKAIQLDNRDYESYFYRGGVYYKLEDMDATCGDYKTALTRISAKDTAEYTQLIKEDIISNLAEFCDTSHPGYYYQRGVASYNLKQFEKAITWYNKGLVKFPKHFMLTSFRGNAHFALGNFPQAESDYTQSLANRNQLPAEVNQSMNFRNADALQKQAYINGSLADVYRQRAEVRINLNNYTGALADIEETLKIIPPDAPGKEYAYNTKGAIYLATEDYNNALMWFNKALQLTPGFPLALINRAIVKLNLAYKVRITDRQITGQYFHIRLPEKETSTVNIETLESALLDCNKAITIDPGFAYAYYTRAAIKIALNQGDYCYDLLKAAQMGLSYAQEMVVEKKCK